MQEQSSSGHREKQRSQKIDSFDVAFLQMVPLRGTKPSLHSGTLSLYQFYMGEQVGQESRTLSAIPEYGRLCLCASVIPVQHENTVKGQDVVVFCVG
jgi:hypothetical protein